MKVAVVGASGFAGYAVYDYLLGKGFNTVPLVGSTGNSWRLLSRGITPRLVSVLDPQGLRQALHGCSHVVNCLRGDQNVMLQGTRNLVNEALRAGATRFVHLSSVAIYGDPPAPEAAVESAKPAAKKGTYGWTKLRQDEIVERGAERGLSSIVLCPPNIIGPGSYYLLDVLGSLLKGELLLADGGETPCSTVDVRNLAHACFLALSKGKEDGARYFVTDDEPVSWAMMVEGLRAGGRIARSPPGCTLEELRRLSAPPAPPRIDPWRSLKHLVSSDVRAALRKDPLLANLDHAARALVGRLGPAVEENLRLAIEGPMKSQRASGGEVNIRLSAQQLRGVCHRCDKAKAELGYRPIVTFVQSMAAFSRWLQGTRGMQDPDWECRKVLFGYPVGD